MSLTRANPGTWGIGEQLTAAQINDIDTNATYALDKRAGQTDTISSVVTASGAGRIVPTIASGADADTTYLAGGGNRILRVPTASASRAYTLSATGAQDGDVITIVLDSAFPSIHVLTIKDQAAATLATMGTIYLTTAGRCASFIYHSAGWHLFRSGRDAWGATLDSSSKVTSTQRAGWLVSAQIAKLTADVVTSSASLVDVTGLSITLTAAVGDIIQASSSFQRLNTGAGSSVAQLVIVDGGVTTFLGCRHPLSVAVATPGSSSSLYTALNAGSLVVKLQHQNISATSATVVGDASTSNFQSSIQALQFRP